MKRACLFRALGVLLLLGGCSDALIPPAQVPPPTVPSASYSASFTLQPGAPREFGSVPAGGWYNVSFGGTITLTTHPGLVSRCITYENTWLRPWVCPMPLEGAQVGPAGVERCAKTSTDCSRVMYIRSICAHGGSCAAPYHPLEHHATGSLIFVHRGFGVQVESVGESEKWSDNISWYPAYIISGEYSMQIQGGAAAPFTVTLDANAALGGDSVRHTTDVTQPWEWVFVAGDTAAEPQTPPQLEYELPRIVRCNYRSSCDLAPVSGGRMYVRGRMGNGSVGWAAGPVVGVQDTLAITLTCTSAAQRGATAGCRVTWTPTTIAAGDIQFSWRFDADSVRVFPDSLTPAFEPPPPVDTAGAGLSEWFGPVVIGGRVSVNGTHGGVTRTDSARITITARGGTQFGDLPVSLAPGFVDVPTDSTLTLSAQPHVNAGGGPGMVGQNYDTASSSGQMNRAIHGEPEIRMVAAGGPNAGYWYVVNPNVRSTRGIRMRTWITGKERPKFRYPTVTHLLTNRGLLEARRTNPNPNAPRMHNDSTEFFLGVLAHESRGRNGRKGHQGQIEAAARSLPTCGRVPTLLERVVARDSAGTRLVAEAVLEEGRKSLFAAAWHDHVYGNYSNGPFYEVVATVTQAVNLAWKISVGDAQQAPHPLLAPDPLYRCSRVY